MINVIEKFIEANKEEWVEGTADQVGKIITLIEGKTKEFVCNNEEFGVYLLGEVNYGGHEGKMYTLDVEELSRNTEEYLERWTIPTMEGLDVDINLIV